MSEWLRWLGRRCMDTTARVGRGSLFLGNTLLGMPRLVRRPGLVVAQVYAAGVLSVIIVAVSGIFVGMVLALQGYNTLIDFGAEQSLGTLVALSLTRELGPVVTALLFAGRAGSAMTAELGLMKATEQLASMEMMAVDPAHRIMAPRLVAGVIAMPLLATLFTLLGILASYVVGTALLGIDGGSFWSQMQASVSFGEDVLNGLAKSLAFGFVAAWVAVFEGHDCTPTSEGVSRATTRTVVHTSLAVLALDFVLTALMFN